MSVFWCIVLAASCSAVAVGSTLSFLVWMGEEQYKAKHPSFLRWLIPRFKES